MVKTEQPRKPNPGVNSRHESYRKTYKEFATFCKLHGWKIYVKLEELMRAYMEEKQKT